MGCIYMFSEITFKTWKSVLTLSALSRGILPQLYKIRAYALSAEGEGGWMFHKSLYERQTLVFSYYVLLYWMS